MNILNISLTATIFIFIIILIRKFFLYKISKQIFLYCWILLLIRLLIPVPIYSRFSVETILDIIKYNDQMYANVITFNKSISSFLKIFWLNYHFTFIIIWFIVMIILAFSIVLAYFKNFRKFRFSKPINNAFIQTWKEKHSIKRNYSIRTLHIQSPLTFGVFSPVILLPENMDLENQKFVEFVLLHEYIHIKKFHSVLKFFLLIVCCLNWFNPFVWIMFSCMNNDMELACDEFVIEEIGLNKRKDYAKFLIKAQASHEKRVLYSYLKNDAIEQRLIAIMKVKKETNCARIASWLIVALVALFFLTSSSYFRVLADRPCLMKTDDEIYSNKVNNTYTPPKENVLVRNGLSNSHLINSGVTAVYDNDKNDFNYNVNSMININLSISVNRSINYIPTGVIGYILNGVEHELYVGALEGLNINFTTTTTGHYLFYLTNASSEPLQVNYISITEKGGET